jgi:2-keto-4-pentenoate hydratase/2-oxohepta-3-ene-1,7-dioic acid hydratase in catechol pathway
VRFATYEDPQTGEDRAGAVLGEAIHALRPPARLADLLGDDGERLAQAWETARSDPLAVVGVADVRLRPPIAPRSLRDFYAFEQHVRTARERRGLTMEPDWYELPVFYFSNVASIAGDRDEIAVPPGCAELDYELEVAAVVGREGADLTADEAEACIAGYMVMNDWSARDVQRREMKLNLGPAKGKDFATSLGPVLVTPDELDARRAGKAFDLTMTATVNGHEWSRASLADLHWSFGEMLAYASRGTRVLPGDVIGSGTCGTGCILELSLVHGTDTYPWLAPGDEVTLAVDGLGSLTNTIV